MATETDLSRYVRDALQAGRAPNDIATSLTKAGWSEAEIDVALQAWVVIDGAGPIPRPVRSTAAREAFFYALLFIVFAVIVGNTLALLFAQINIRLPETSETIRPSQLSGVRWSIAALIVFVPVFWWLNRADTRALTRDPAHQFLTMRRWLSAIALLCAVIALLTDALFLIYRWLDGQMTLRFALKSAVVAGMALIVLAYFDENRRFAKMRLQGPASALLTGIAILAVVATLWTIGGPAQGAAERRDQVRLADLSTLAQDLRNCPLLDLSALPAEFDPMACARNPARFGPHAETIRYALSPPNAFELCIDVEVPDAITNRRMTVSGTEVCLREQIE